MVRPEIGGMMPKRRILDAAFALAAAAARGRRRGRQQRVGRATSAERVLYAAQRQRELPPGHPYA
jgi:hypothetical protein